MPTLVNALGSLDVDIILDEGPDYVNQMADAYDALTALVQGGTQIPPPVLIELAPIPNSVKKKIQEMMNPTDPQSQQKKQQQDQMQTAGAMAEIQKTQAEAKLKEAQAQKALAEANQPPQQQSLNLPPPPEHPAIAASKAEQGFATARLKHAQADKIGQDMALEPHRIAIDQENANAERAMQLHQANLTARKGT